jgi:hypothetical protein
MSLAGLLRSSSLWIRRVTSFISSLAKSRRRRYPSISSLVYIIKKVYYFGMVTGMVTKKLQKKT